MLEKELIDKSFITTNLKPNLFFAHLYAEADLAQSLPQDFIQSNEKDNWKTHKELISKGRNPNPIAEAIRNDDVDQLQQLISGTSNLDSIYERCTIVSQKVSLIQYASFYRSEKCYRFLANPEQLKTFVTEDGKELPIFYCDNIIHSINNSIIYRNTDLFQYFMKSNTNFNLTELMGLSIEMFNFPIFIELLELYKSFDVSSVHTKCASYNFPLFKFFSTFDCLSSFNFQAAFEASCSSVNIQVIKWLKTQIGDLIDPTSYLEIVCHQKDQKLFELLLDGIDLKLFTNEYGSTILHYFCEHETSERIKCLFNNKQIKEICNVADAVGYTPLHTACSFGKKEIIETLLEQEDVNVNIQNSSGFSALHFACEKCEVGVVKLLLKAKNINVNIKSKLGLTPLHVACKKDYKEIVEILLTSEDIDVNTLTSLIPIIGADGKVIQTLPGKTPLMIALQHKNFDIFSLLLTHKNINVNVRDINEKTVLHMAVSDNEPKFIVALLNHKDANINVRDNDGKKPEELTQDKEIIGYFDQFKNGVHPINYVEKPQVNIGKQIKEISQNENSFNFNGSEMTSNTFGFNNNEIPSNAFGMNNDMFDDDFNDFSPMMNIGYKGGRSRSKGRRNEGWGKSDLMSWGAPKVHKKKGFDITDFFDG
ncbi:serine/threonine-protein phosphatase 6 regulatory ankyrin repeat subunit B-like [Histomonas meleagridis]|uniref:serine/threonine-protein phosphatase 6 regulatory ankyrin repeat subunit B-like n=1 Tax=Histomonas meleagridis TaxID=135588 RepID=UPI00355A9CF4|nr:serine/threonine-protein phosphatase 6 regulatory ankyrin repeat subunit B-like [Histomonas meleagridis]KAH0796988.1 serine/threonine-protein phosphatase 6 regulatory ankyrin repeat subunit B-like [Histomonas meleagridis]